VPVLVLVLLVVAVVLAVLRVVDGCKLATVLVSVLLLVAVVLVIAGVVVGSKGTNASGRRVTSPTLMDLISAPATPSMRDDVELTSSLRKVGE